MKDHPNYFLNSASVIGFLLMTLVLINDVQHLEFSWPLLVAAIVIGYLLADLTSGIVHFIGDTFGSENTPIIGKAFIFPFREHHVDQTAITRHNFLVTNGHNCLVSLPVMVGMHFLLIPFPFLFLTGVSLVLSVFMTNQFHKWAHQKNPPSMIKFLQDKRLILNPAHHAIHHTAPYNRYYCITTGWLNPIWERVQRMIMTR